MLTANPGDLTATTLGVVGSRALASVTDSNADGIPDLIVGLPGLSGKGATVPDISSITIALGTPLPGSTTAIGKLADAITIACIAVGDFFGFAVGSATDRNGKSLDEIVAVLSDQNADGNAKIPLASHTANGGAGAVYFVDGKALGLQVKLTDLAAGMGSYVINGVAGDGAGSTVSDAGDVTGDGRHDILDDAAGHDVLSCVSCDATYHIHGASDDIQGILGHDTLDTTESAANDRIDPAAFDVNAFLAYDQAFAFMGGAVFSHAAGELRLAGNGAGILQLSGDMNGDGFANFAIVPGNTPVPAPDFNCPKISPPEASTAFDDEASVVKNHNKAPILGQNGS